MAITRHSLTQGNTGLDHADTTITTSITVPSGSDRLIVVCTAQESNNLGTHQIASSAFGGVALTQLAEAADATWSHAEIWYLKNPAVSTANVVTTLTAADNARHGIYVFSGVDQATTFRTPQTGMGNAASSSLTVPGVIAGDYLVDAVGLDGIFRTGAVGADQTEEYNFEGIGFTACSSTQPGSAGGVMSWTWSAGDYSHVATALIAALPPADMTMKPGLPGHFDPYLVPKAWF